MIRNTTEQIIVPEVPNVIPNQQLNVYVPTSGNEQAGLAKFYKEHFTVVDGLVKIKPDYIHSILAENFQTKNDDGFITKNKTVVGAVNEIYNALDESLDRSVKYIKFVAPEALLNGPDSNVTIESFPKADVSFNINGVIEYFNLGDEYKGDFTLEGSTKYLTDEYIDTEGEDLFFAIRRSIKPSSYGGAVGFTLNLNEYKDVETVQLYLWGVYQNLQLIVQAFDGVDWIEYPLNIEKQSQNTLNVYRVHINKKVNSINVLQKGEGNAHYRFIVKGIELFAPTTNGQYKLVQRNGVISSWDTFDALTWIEKVNQSVKDSNDALSSANKILSMEGKVGGWPVLDSNEKLFAQYIPSIVKTDYEVINIDWSQIDENNMTVDEINAKINELAYAKLVTLSHMETGDIAGLIKYETDVNGYIRGKLIKSWILLGKSSLGYQSEENWYEQSVATAGSAAFAKQAENANNSLTVGGIKIEGVYTSKEYEDLVNAGQIDENVIYIVEV